MRSGVRSPSAPPNPPRVARFTRSPAAATARSKMTAIHFDRRGKLDDWSSDTFDHAQIGARLNDSHTNERARVAVGSLWRDDKSPQCDEDKACEEKEICDRVSGLMT